MKDTIELNKIVKGIVIFKILDNQQTYFENNIRWIKLLFFTLIFFTSSLSAQEIPFQNGEQLNFNIYFNYGIVMAKAGTAQHKMTNTTYSGKSCIKSQLTFKTTSTFDKIFKVRDSLWSYASYPDLRPFFHEKSLNEGKSTYKEELFYLTHGAQYSKTRSLRKTDQSVKFDTILFSNGLGYDMLSFFVYVRMFDFPTMEIGESQSIVCFVGRDVVKMKLRNAGQTILVKSEFEKIKTIRFEVDVIDEAFETNKNAMEIWISDDKNRIPVKIRAKLKIGAMEAELSSSKNLKYPFDSKITIKPR